MDPKYKITLASSPVKCIYDKDKSTFLSEASIEALKSIIPANSSPSDLTDSGYFDLLRICGNSCTPNLANRNGHVIDTETALRIAKYFVHKPINIEHSNTIIGHGLAIGYSKFDYNFASNIGSELLTEDEARAMTQPFNLALAGCIYRRVAEDIASLIIDSNNPQSPNYLQISYSWEIGFNSFKIAVGSPVLSEATIISDPAEIEEKKQYLQFFDGKGKLPTGEPIYLYVCGETVVPVGMAITSNPAALVAGLVVADSDLPIFPLPIPAEAAIEPVEEPIIEPVVAELEVVEASIVPTPEVEPISPAISVNDITTIKTPIMKIELKSLAQVENLKDEDLICVASLKDLSKDIVAKIAEHDLAVKAAQDAETKKAQEVTDALAKISELQTKLDEVALAQAIADKQAKFDRFMETLDANYDLDDEQHAAVAEQTRDFSTDEEFSRWETGFAKFAKKSKKAAPAPKEGSPDEEKNESPDFEKKEDEDKEKKAKAELEAKAKLEEEEAARVAKASITGSAEHIADILARASKKVTAPLPSTAPAEGSLSDQFKNAFSKENITFSK